MNWNWLKQISNLTSKGRLIRFFIYATYVAYIGMFIGVSFINTRYIQLLQYGANLYIGLSLIYYFNPFYKNVEITSTMRRIIFTSGVVLLTNIFANELVLLHL